MEKKRRVNDPLVNQEAQARFREKLRDEGITAIRINATDKMKKRLMKVPGNNHSERLLYLLDKAGF